MKYIGLTGRPKSGKSTIATYIDQDLQYIVGIASFERPVLDMICAMRGKPILHENYIINGENDILLDIGISYREAIESLINWGRSRHPDYWIRLFQKSKEYKYQKEESEYLLKEKGMDSWGIIEDVRFQNEANWIKSNGGVIWYIDRPLETKEQENWPENEICRSCVDAVIPNHGTLDEFEEHVRFTMDEMGLDVDRLDPGHLKMWVKAMDRRLVDLRLIKNDEKDSGG